MFCRFWRIYEIFSKFQKYKSRIISMQYFWEYFDDQKDRNGPSNLKRHVFFFKPFSIPGKSLKKKTCFCEFKGYFYGFDNQTILKNIAWILCDFCIFGILKKTHKFVKIGKTSGNTLEGIFWYGEIMSLQLKHITNFVMIKMSPKV